MRKTVFPRRDVMKLFGKFALAELYTDKGPQKNANRKLRSGRFHEDALPLYIILSPDGKTEYARHKAYTPDPQDFVDFLKRGLEAFRQGG